MPHSVENRYSRQTNPLDWELINTFAQRTNEPIVRTPFAHFLHLKRHIYFTFSPELPS